MFKKELRDHIGNCLEHVKMLPLYLDLGFDPKKFNSDYHEKKMDDGLMSLLKQKYRNEGFYLRAAVDTFIGKYFAMVACNNKAHNYFLYYEGLKKLDTFSSSWNIFLSIEVFFLDLSLSSLCSTILAVFNIGLV